MEFDIVNLLFGCSCYCEGWQMLVILVFEFLALYVMFALWVQWSVALQRYSLSYNYNIFYGEVFWIKFYFVSLLAQ